MQGSGSNSGQILVLESTQDLLKLTGDGIQLQT